MVHPGNSPDLPISDYKALGEFRYQIRRFQHFSETAARAEDLEPQQHQMMLAIRAWEEPDAPSVGDLAAHLLLKHHSAVGLVDRLEERGLVERVRGDCDRRHVRVHLTAGGLAKLERLSSVHREELRTSGPLLVNALGALLRGLSGDGPLPLHARKAEDVRKT
jgi:DNA-binding MarR family transcriptional regulator